MAGPNYLDTRILELLPLGLRCQLFAYINKVVALCHSSGSTDVPQGCIADDLGVCDRQARRYEEALIELGLLHKSVRRVGQRRRRTLRLTQKLRDLIEPPSRPSPDRTSTSGQDEEGTSGASPDRTSMSVSPPPSGGGDSASPSEVDAERSESSGSPPAFGGGVDQTAPKPFENLYGHLRGSA